MHPDAKAEVAQVDLGWQRKGELFIVLLWFNSTHTKYHVAAQALPSSPQSWWDGEEDQIKVKPVGSDNN